jgi:TonB family protein
MSWAHYLLQVNIYLIIFYCFYKLLLNKETYFGLNRLYLVSSGIFSLAIPFLRFELFSEKIVSNKLYVSVSEINTVVSNYAVLPQTQEQYDWGRLIVIIYILGAFIYFLSFLYQLFTINQLFNKPVENGAFSFLNRKSVAANLPERATIDLHEDIHVKQLHSLDVIFFEIIGIITWFNPVIYAYKKTIKNIHEYLADEAAAKFQGDKETYAMLLLSQALGIKPNSLTNGFASKSLIKKRIFMLHKQRSKKIAVLKYGIFIPLFALAVVLSSATIRKNNQILAVAEKITLENAKAIVNQVFNNPTEIIDLTTTDLKTENLLAQNVSSNTNSEFNANAFTDFFNYIAATIKYPEAAARKRIQGNTIVNFTIKNGRVIDVIPQVELGSGCEQEVENSILSFNSNIAQDGKYSLKVAFKLENANSEFKNEGLTALDPYHELQTITVNGFVNKEKFNQDKTALEAYNNLPALAVNEADNTIENKASNYISMSSPPLFIGGMDKLNTFLESSIVYPSDAVDNEIQGVVIVNFTVEKDGSLSNIKTDKKLGFGIDEEAIRVLKLTKKWYPATQNGKAVSVAYSMPIKFSFEQPKKASKGTIIASIRLKNYAESENSPLFIVDGQLKAKSIAKDLDEKKIDRIAILKEANAMAIYGKKGENGAVIITSKKPENPRVSATLFK